MSDCASAISRCQILAEKPLHFCLGKSHSSTITYAILLILYFTFALTILWN